MSKIMKIFMKEKHRHRHRHTHTHAHTHMHTHTRTYTRTKKNKGDGSYSKRVRDTWFCWAFKLGFLYLICKTSFIFKLNLELALSIILKETELNESKNVAVQCRCLKLWDLLFFLLSSSILVLWRQVLPI